MLLKQILFEDFTNYKKASMFLGFPRCTFKCEKECGIQCCQNSELAIATAVDFDIDELIEKYLNNFITSAVVLGGLEPMDTFDDVMEFI